MIKEKYTSRLYDIYPTSPPDTVETSAYRGDYFTFTVIGYNEDDTPFDFSIFSDFKAQIRVADPRNPSHIYDFEWSTENRPGDEFVLGKKTLEQDEYDTLSIITDKGFTTDCPYPLVWLDVEAITAYTIMNEKEVYEKNTLIKVKINLESDVTRHG